MKILYTFLDYVSKYYFLLLYNYIYIYKSICIYKSIIVLHTKREAIKKRATYGKAGGTVRAQNMRNMMLRYICSYWK